MTREEFDNLKVGDKIIHAFGGIGIVTEKEENGYTVRDKDFDCGDGCCEVSFAWNEGEIVKNELKPKRNMTQEDKQLLLADLCARLPYGVKAQVCGWDEEKGEVEVPLKVYSINTDGYLSFEYNHYSVETVYVEDCRLYLRPMSSMTEEETEEYRRLQSDIWKPCGTMYYDTADSIDWLNAHHFDYHYVSGRGYLIDAGLALEAHEGMYD